MWRSRELELDTAFWTASEGLLELLLPVMLGGSELEPDAAFWAASEGILDLLLASILGEGSVELAAL